MNNTKMRHIICEKAGTIDEIKIVDTIIPEPKDNQVQIAVRAVSLSVSDFGPFIEKAETGKVSFLSKIISQNKAFGGDISGVVTKAGNTVSTANITTTTTGCAMTFL